MIKTILISLLILPPAQTYPELITWSVCEELADVLMESVEDGYIKKQEAEDIYKRCLTLNT